MTRALGMLLVAIYLAGCGGRAASPQDPPTPDEPEPEDCSGSMTPTYDEACAGNVGCTEITPEYCGCSCVRCSDEQCVDMLCTENCMPPPPSEGRCAEIDPANYPSGQLNGSGELDAACAGNSGCTEMDTSWIGCECSLCDGERCVEAICSEPMTPVCPVDLPAVGEACGGSSGDPSCDYFIASCDCGPSDLYHHCSCVEGVWHCLRDYDCYPCD